MLLLRNWNGSHNPDEAMDEADLAWAVWGSRQSSQVRKPLLKSWAFGAVPPVSA